MKHNWSEAELNAFWILFMKRVEKESQFSLFHIKTTSLGRG
jgi:hypothetical protein